MALSFINFNLPQFYQIVKVDGREQVILFRTQTIGNDARPPIRITIRRHYSSIFRDERRKASLSGMQS